MQYKIKILTHNIQWKSVFARATRKIKPHVDNRFTATNKKTKTWRIVQLQPSFSYLCKQTTFNYYHEFNGDVSSVFMRSEQTPSVEEDCEMQMMRGDYYVKIAFLFIHTGTQWTQWLTNWRIKYLLICENTTLWTNTEFFEKMLKQGCFSYPLKADGWGCSVFTKKQYSIVWQQHTKVYFGVTKIIW